MTDYEFIGPYGINGFARHRHPEAGIEHGHDGGAFPHDPDDYPHNHQTEDAS